MLTPDSVRQLIDVLTLVRHAHSRGVPVPRAYQDAVRDVSNRHRVRYQTIGDLCRRRLALRDVDQFLDMLGRWLRGDATPLKQAMQRNADHVARPLIDTFFAESDPAAVVETATGKRQTPEPTGIPARQMPLLGREDLRLRISPELERRIQLATLAGLGPTREDAAIELLERGFAAERDRIAKGLQEI